MEMEGFGIAGRLAIGVAVAGELADRRNTRRDEKDEEAVSPQSDIMVGKVLWSWVMKFEVGSWGDVAVVSWRLINPRSRPAKQIIHFLERLEPTNHDI